MGCSVGYCSQQYVLCMSSYNSHSSTQNKIIQKKYVLEVVAVVSFSWRLTTESFPEDKSLPTERINQ